MTIGKQKSSKCHPKSHQQSHQKSSKIPFNDNRHPFFADSTNVHGNLSMPSLKVRVTGGLITQISLDEESQLFQDYFNFRFLKHFFVCVLKKTIINFSISHLLVAFSRLKMILEHLYQLAGLAGWKTPSLQHLRMECVVSRIDQGTLHLSCPVTGVEFPAW